MNQHGPSRDLVKFSPPTKLASAKRPRLVLGLAKKRRKRHSIVLLTAGRSLQSRFIWPVLGRAIYMIWFLKSGKPAALGIDVGSASLKVAELSRSGDRTVLEAYAEYQNPLFEKSFQPIARGAISYSNAELGLLLKEVVKEAGITTKKAVMSLPSPSAFVITFDLPFMTPDEVPTAVMHEARQRIPVPLGEVEIDWSLFSDIPEEDQRQVIRVLLVAVPKEIIANYTEIANIAGFTLLGIEAEVFSLARALLGGEPRPAILVDIGAASTSVGIVEGENILLNHNFWMGGKELTIKIMQSTGQTVQQAEYYKKKIGVKDLSSESIARVLVPHVDEIITEVGRVAAIFKERFHKDIELVVLSGGSASLPGLRELFLEKLDHEIVIGNPFAKIFTPPILASLLKEIGPAFSIATGLALRGLG